MMYSFQTVAAVLDALESSEAGISEYEAVKRLEHYGPNELPQKKRSLLLLFVKQFHSILIYILLGAMVLSIVLPIFEGHGHISWTDFIDAIVIGAILVINAVLGFVQEWKADNAIAMLQALSEPHVRVRRDNVVQSIASREIVPGDILLLEEGDKISADGRVILERNAKVNEASLTGESLPQSKTTDVIMGNPSVADQENMVFCGTVVTSGHMEVCVTGTGKNTELGNVAALVSSVEHPPTPLERSMQHLSKWLGIIVLTFCALIFVVGEFHDMPFAEMLLASVSLAVSAVPEGLPAIVTVSLAIGVQRMIRRNVLTRELGAIETLGSITVICTDKTGTITKNEMRVEEIEEGKNEKMRGDGLSLLQIAASCNNAHSLDVGDPTEIGLLQASVDAGVKRLDILEEVEPFTSDKMYMVTRHGGGEGLEEEKRRGDDEVYFIKGAPEVIINMCDLSDEEKRVALKKNEEMAGKALRVLGFGYKSGGTLAPLSVTRYTFAGLIGLMDPPRDGVMDAIKIAQGAGIRTIMITGDHAITARAIAGRVGIASDVIAGADLAALSDEDLQAVVRSTSIFARVSPSEKVRILTALQDSGEIVAMGGDGVNDAPALKKAHVGFAMGLRGTDVARETAEIVLTDDHFASVVNAIEEGRTIYDNIRKFVVYLLRANFDELLTVLGAILIGAPLPYLPIHILLINLTTDSLPAMALAVEKEEGDVMRRPPRNPHDHILKGEILFIALAAVLATIAAFHIFFTMLHATGDADLARTMVVVNSIMFELTLVFTCRSKQPLLRIGVFSNRYLLGAVSIAFIALLIFLYTPLNIFLHLVPLTLAQWVLPLCWSFGVLAFFEILKVFRHK